MKCNEIAKGVFISYSSRDREFARKLARDLTRRGIPVWFDETELEPGDSIIGAIEDGIDRMACLIVVLSPASVTSGWVTEEIRLALHKGIAGKKFGVIPMLIADCEIPGFLRDKKYVDMRPEADYQAGVEAIVRKVGRGREHESLSGSLQLEFDRLRNDEQFSALRPVLDFLEPLVNLTAEKRDKDIDKELLKVLRQLQPEGKRGADRRIHVGKMTGGFIQNGWNVAGDVHQANRDVIINTIKNSMLSFETIAANSTTLETGKPARLSPSTSRPWKPLNSFVEKTFKSAFPKMPAITSR